MTPTSNKPLAKVWVGGLAAAVATIVLFLFKRFVWQDFPADLEGPINTVILAGVLGGASMIGGWFTPILPGEIKAVDKRIIEGQAKP